MATYSKIKLSSSTDGKALKIAATSSAGDTIHTAHATSLDEIWIYAYNGHTASVELTLQVGGTTSPDNDIKVTIGSKAGHVLVLAGLILTNSLIVKAYAATTNVITLQGFVNRIT
jgi:hypothetical protein